MNAGLKAKWIAALRSGGYKQGYGQLRDGDAFCCLGVLCDISKTGAWEGNRYKGAGDHNAAASLVPSKVVEASGITWQQQDVLYHLNDAQTYDLATGLVAHPNSFDIIANYIDANL